MGLIYVFVYVLFVNVKGQCPDTANSTQVMSCNGRKTIGTFIEIDFNKINKPCTCIVILLFEGVLLGTTRKASTWCHNPVTVNATIVLDCNGASDTANVKINDTLVVKAAYQQGHTSGEFYQCLVLRENGGGGGYLSVTCGTQQITTQTTETSTQLSEIESSTDVSSLPSLSSQNAKDTSSITTLTTTQISDEVSSIKPISAKNENDTSSITIPTSTPISETESSSEVPPVKSTSTRNEKIHVTSFTSPISTQLSEIEFSSELSSINSKSTRNERDISFQVPIVILAVISFVSIILNIYLIIQKCFGKASRNILKNGNITKPEKETYLELGETTREENQYDSLSCPNYYSNMNAP